MKPGSFQSLNGNVYALFSLVSGHTVFKLTESNNVANEMLTALYFVIAVTTTIM